MNQKLLLGLIIAAVVVFALYSSGLLTLLTDQKAQLKQEYNTYADSLADWQLTWNPNTKTQENDKFSCSSGTSLGNIRQTTDYLEMANSGSGASCTVKKSFNGEVALLVGGVGNPNIKGYALDCNANGQGSDCDKIIKIIFKPHTLDLKGDIIKDGNIVGTVDFPLQLSFSAPYLKSLEVYGIYEKAQYSCDLRSDEVWVQEAFAQPFTINDLSFPPTKFCKEVRPFTLRDVTHGETAIYPDPIPSFNRGETLQVPSGQIITVNYATPNVVSVLNPCAPDQANIKVAGRWVCSQVIKTTTLTREVPVREIVQVSGANQFTSTKNFNIGSSAFTQSQSFSCQFPSDVDIVHFPQPSSDCYSSTVSYEGKSYSLKDSQSTPISAYISMQYFAGGEITREKQNLQGTYIFNIANPLEINVNGGITFKQNNKGAINLKITNNLPANTLTLKIQQKVVNTNQNLPEMTTNLNAANGDNDFAFDIDTSNLGINEIDVQVFYPIDADAKILLPSDKIKINVEVQGEQQSIIKFVEIEKPVYVTQTQYVQQGFWDWLISLWSYIASLFK